MSNERRYCPHCGQVIQKEYTEKKRMFKKHLFIYHKENKGLDGSIRLQDFWQHIRTKEQFANLRIKEFENILSALNLYYTESIYFFNLNGCYPGKRYMVCSTLVYALKIH